MKKIVLLAAIGIGISIAACSKLKESPDPITADPIQLTPDIKPVAQTTIASYFAANPGSSETLKGDVSTFLNLTTKSGAVIMIYPNSLVDMDGNDITGEVTFQLEEFYTTQDILKGNVQTLTDKGEILETGGMFKLEASQNGKQLRIKDGFRYGVQFPNTESGMEPYIGTNDSDGRVNWARRNDWLRQTDTTRGNNVIYLDSFTYCNLDRLGNYPNKTDMTVVADPANIDLTLNVCLVFKDKRIIASIPKSSIAGKYETGSYYDVPQGEVAQLVAYGIDKEGYLYWYDSSHTIGDNEELSLPKLEKISESDWKARLAALK